MKLSNISIIFIIIMIPVILVLSYYISLQIDTINMQTSYTTKQLEATKEAVEAFEINTVEWNEAYSENADSKRRDIMASVNTFTTSFANSLGIGGTNKEYLESYIPAIACTLYDGYYIYTPSEVKSVIKDENGVAVFITEKLVKSEPSPITNYTYEDEHEGKLLYEYDSGIEGASSDGIYRYEDEDGNYIETQFTLNSAYAKSTYEHILKPFSTYSARYKKGDTDITVNYTLDNYITIYGSVRGEYVVESGYLICEGNQPSDEYLSEKIAWRDNESDNYTCQMYNYVYDENKTKVYIQEEVKIDSEGNQYNKYTPFQVSSTGIRTDLSKMTEIKYKKRVISENMVVYQALSDGNIQIKRNDGSFDNIAIKQGSYYVDKQGTEIDIIPGRDPKSELTKDFSAQNYYIESRKFTKWVNDKLSDITVNDIQGVEDKSTYGPSNDAIFNIYEDNNPEEEKSAFYNHKREIIKQTLISNLNQAITSYSRNSEGEYRLPILTETDWDHVLRNVSIITFVQGMPIGMKYYNNYAIATSTSNKEYINPDEIYLSIKGDDYYHLPYCEKLNSEDGYNRTIGYKNIDYVVKSYQEGDNTNYYYKHSNIANQSCYYCLVQRDLYNETTVNTNYEKQEIAYNEALARERYNTNKGLGEHSTVENLYQDSLTFTISFSDENNRDGIRPNTVEVKLYENGAWIENRDVILGLETAGGTGEWSCTWENLDQYRNGTKIDYTVVTSFDNKDKYNEAQSINNVTNTILYTYEYIPEKTSKNINIVFDDYEDRHNLRPDEITVELYKKVNETETYLDEVELKGNAWEAAFDNLYKYENGQEIVYTIEADQNVDFYKEPKIEFNETNQQWTITYTIKYRYAISTEPATWTQAKTNCANWLDSQGRPRSFSNNRITRRTRLRERNNKEK